MLTIHFKQIVDYNNYKTLTRYIQFLNKYTHKKHYCSCCLMQ